MLTIDDLIQQAESRKKLHEQNRRLFEDGTMTLHRNGKEVSRVECVAKEARFIAEDEAEIASLKCLQAAGRVH